MVGSLLLAELVRDLAVLCLFVIAIVTVVLITILCLLNSMLFSSLPTTVLVHHLENNFIIAGRPSIVNLEHK